MSRKIRKLQSRGFKRPRYQGPAPTPLSALGPGRELRITTECVAAPEQPKEPPREDPAYKRWLIANVPNCQHCGAIATQPSHHNVEMHGAVAMKPPDRRLIMLCHPCHFGEGKDGHHHHGRLKGLSYAESRAKVEALIRENNLAYGDGK